MTCADCAQFCESLSPEPTRHKQNPLALERSSQDGCHFCKIILGGLLRYYKNLKDQKVRGNCGGKPPEEQVWLRVSYRDGRAWEDESDPYAPLPKGFSTVTSDMYPFWLEAIVREVVVPDEWISWDLDHHFSSKKPLLPHTRILVS
jgi:hypothetical protein